MRLGRYSNFIEVGLMWSILFVQFMQVYPCLSHVGCRLGMRLGHILQGLMSKLHFLEGSFLKFISGTCYMSLNC